MNMAKRSIPDCHPTALKIDEHKITMRFTALSEQFKKDLAMNDNGLMHGADGARR